VPKFLETVLEASPVCNSLHYEEADVAFTWENGRTDDLRLKSWKQELCKRSNNCLTLEIHIRPADTFSTGSIQSLGYAFYLRLKDMRPIKEGSVQVYQDGDPLEPSLELQLVFLPYAKSTPEQVRELRLAAGQGSAEEVEQILGRPQDPEEVAIEEEDLFGALPFGYFGAEIAETLAVTPLFVAAKNGHTEAVLHLLLEAKAHPDKGCRQCTPLVKACAQGHAEVVQTLLQSGADKDRCGESGYGNEELVRILLAVRAEPDKYGDVDVTPLARASRHGSVAIAGMLLAAGAEKDKDSKQTFKLRFGEERATGWTPLVEAAQHGHLGVVRLLLEAKADKDKLSHGRTALVKACEFGHVGVASFLLQEGADANRASNHCTALSWATRLGRLDLAGILLEAGASTGEDGENLPPLSWACRLGHLKMTCLLLEARANVEQGCFKPLLEASQNGHQEITRALLHAGADPNAGSFIPLVEASHEGHADIVHQLLAARADAEKRGHSDLTALEKATLRGHQEIVDLLAKAASKKPQSSTAEPREPRKLGLAHEAYFQHFGVDSACLRLEKRVRLLPEEELEKLCGDCFTLGTSHLSRVRDFKARAMRGVAEAETQATPLQAADGEDSIKRALSVRSREKNEMMRDHESDREAPTSSDEEAEVQFSLRDIGTSIVMCKGDVLVNAAPFPTNRIVNSFTLCRVVV
ncbi:Ankrd17, partial [Symbiodinium sp. KB8]